MKRNIKDTQAELSAWLECQPDHIRAIGGSVIGLLSSAQIGARPHPMILAHLAEGLTSTPGH